jgi:hypothetical protein
MQYALRPYFTTGIAVVGAGVIAVAPVPVVSPAAGPLTVTRSVQLMADPYTDLFTNTVANLQNISANADWSAISQVFTALFTNPLGVIGAMTNITPDVTTDLTSLPATVSVQLPPALELLIANMGSQVATMNAINGVVTQLSTDPANMLTTLINAPAVIANAYLNGQDNLSLLGGILTIPAYNGILAPESDLGIDLNLTKLLDLLGLGNLDLSNLDLTNLLDQIGLGNLTLGSLFSDLGLATKGLGDLLGNPTLSGLLGDLGLGGLGLGSLSLTGILSGLGLDTNVDLNSLSLDDVLSAFGINPTLTLGLGEMLTNLGFGSLVNESLGTLLQGLPSSFLDGITSSLNTVLAGLINGLPLLGPVIQQILGAVVLTPQNLVEALNGITVGDLLGGQTISQTVGELLGALGVSVPTSGLTIGGILEDLGFASSTGDLTLGGLLGDLNLGGLDVTGLLNGVSLGDLLGDLGLSNLPLNLGDLADLSNLNLGDLLNDLGLGNLDLANISVGSFGGFFTELFDTVPQQILAALGG